MACHHHYDDPDDRRNASDPKLVSPSRCATELAYLRGKLDQLALNPTAGAVSPELAALFDSYANEEPGLLFGNYHWTENWRQCSKRLIFDLDRTNASNSISFQGRYCIASIHSDRWQARIEQLTKQRLKSYFKNPQQRYNYQRFFRIQVGICLPESCDSTTIDRAELADVIRQLTVRKLNEPFKSYKLVDLFCLPDETSELRQMDKSGLLFVLCGLAWCLLVVAATCYDFLGPSTNQSKSSSCKGCVEKIVTALSLRRNYIRLTRAELEPAQVGSSKDASHNLSIMKPSKEPGQPGPSDLIFTDFFKVIAMPLVMFGHMCQWLTTNDRYPLAIEMGYHSIVNAVFTIEWYFAIAGFIKVCNSFSSGRLESTTWPQWLYSIFHRYWRLAPMNIIVFWLSRSVLHHTGKGLVWDYGTTNVTLRGICKQESWLWPLTLTSNLHPFQEECILPSWFISSRMQFYLITPFILIGLAKWPKTTWVATVGLIVSSVSLRIHRYYTDPQAPHLDLLRPRRIIQAQVAVDLYPVYLYPQYRISTYLMGLLAGHYTYMVLSGKWNSSFYRFSPSSSSSSDPICRRITWFMSLILCVAMCWASWLLDNTFPKNLEPYAKHFTAFLHGLDHPVVGLAFVLLITTFMLGQFKKLRTLLTHRAWSALSRINFSLLLIHCELIHWNFESDERPLSVNYATLFKDLTWLLFQSYPLAVVGTLLIEFPLAILEREFIGNWLKRKSQVQFSERKPDNKTINCDEKSTFDKCKQNFDLVYVIDCKKSAQTPVYENSH